MGELEKWAEKYEVSIGLEDQKRSYVLEVITLVKERMKLLSEFSKLTYYFFETPVVDLELLKKFGKDKTAKILDTYIELYQGLEIDDWDVQNLDEVSHKLMEQNGYKPREAFMTLRVALTGEKATPPLFDMLSVLGKQTVLQRLKSTRALF